MTAAMADMGRPSESPAPPVAAGAATAAGDAPAAASDGPDHAVVSNAIYAQALWDASMGHAITGALVENLGALVVHFAGSFHVERGTGIPERIADYRPGTRVITVVMTKVEDISAWSPEEHGDLADFVVLTLRPPSMTGGGG
jgi:hypothetical protein